MLTSLNKTQKIYFANQNYLKFRSQVSSTI